MRFYGVSLAILFSLALLVVGCGESNKNRTTVRDIHYPSYNYPNNPDYGGGGGGVPKSTPRWDTDETDPSCPSGQAGDEEGVVAEGEDSSVPDYLSSGEIILHGDYPNRSVLWSSQSNFADAFSGVDPDLLMPDTRFKVRVILKSVAQYSKDAYGNTCRRSPLVFSKGMVRVRVRKRDSSRGEEYVFTANEGCASEVKSFSIPASTKPLVVDVVSVKSDYWCQYYISQGYARDHLGVKTFCDNGNQVHNMDCVSVGLQIATDSTKDFPKASE